MENTKETNTDWGDIAVRKRICIPQNSNPKRYYADFGGIAGDFLGSYLALCQGHLDKARTWREWFRVCGLAMAFKADSNYSGPCLSIRP